MNRKLSDWASIAEIVSGVAVLVTLVFLVVGIRENTAITRASMFDSSMNSVTEFRSLVISDPELADLWDTFRLDDQEFEALERTDRTRLRQMVMMVFEAYQRAYYARSYGVLGESEWSRFEMQMCLQYERAKPVEEIFSAMDIVLAPEFRTFMQGTCEFQDRFE